MDIDLSNTKLCTQCGVERPISFFDKKENGDYKKSCNLDHTTRQSSVQDVVKKYAKREAKKQRRSRKARKMTSVQQDENYHNARHRGPRRITQMKASRLPLNYPTSMSRNDYVIYLTSPHWVSFRDHYRSNNDYSCFVCKGAADDLHHVVYTRIGCEEFDDVVPLCRSCHKHTHNAVKSGVALKNAHVYTRAQYERDQLGVRISVLDKEPPD